MFRREILLPSSLTLFSSDMVCLLWLLPINHCATAYITLDGFPSMSITSPCRLRPLDGRFMPAVGSATLPTPRSSIRGARDTRMGNLYSRANGIGAIEVV